MGRGAGYHNTPPRPVTFVEDEGRKIGRMTRTKDLDEGRKILDEGRKIGRKIVDEGQDEKTKKEMTKGGDEGQNSGRKDECSGTNYVLKIELFKLFNLFIHSLFVFLHFKYAVIFTKSETIYCVQTCLFPSSFVLSSFVLSSKKC